jgi:hypothetical protein
MKGNRAQAKKPPHYRFLACNIVEISYTWHPDIEPLFSRMGLVNLFPCRRRKDLHAVIATAEEHRAHSIDTQMDPSVERFGFMAVTGKDLGDPFVEFERAQGPNQDDKVG